MEWIFIIAIGFICLACPILILLYLQWMPWYVAVAFAIWLVTCIGTIALSKGKNKKWYERMVPSFIATFIFTVLFLAAMDTDHYMFDENIGLWIVAPALSLPAFYLIGMWLNRKWQASQENKRIEYNKNIDKQISDKNAEIRNLEQSIKTKTVITHLVNMLDYCGEDTSAITNDPRVSNISMIVSEIQKERENIQLLQKQKKS